LEFSSSVISRVGSDAESRARRALHILHPLEHPKIPRELPQDPCNKHFFPSIFLSIGHVAKTQVSDFAQRSLGSCHKTHATSIFFHPFLRIGHVAKTQVSDFAQEVTFQIFHLVDGKL
jgi:hypothetical protein